MIISHVLRQACSLSTLFLLGLLLAGCHRTTRLAPVVELKWSSYAGQPNIHQVKTNETLYSIAFRYDKDYRKLAALNHIRYPYRVFVGQRIKLSPYATLNQPQPTKTQFFHSTSVASKPRINQRFKPPTSTVGHQVVSAAWIWPYKGRVVNSFIPDRGKKGIDIAGYKGAPIHAAAGGIVAYAGSGLQGYGNLIIIKHSGQLLTAYGNNLQNKVKEGQVVTKGQVIALMGSIDRSFWGVHFEIRQQGKPINPLKFLPRG